MKKTLLASFVLMLAGWTYGQETLFENANLNLSGFWFSSVHNFSFYERDAGWHRGGSVGLEFGRSLLLGYAWNNLRDDVPFGDGSNTFRLRQNNFLLTLTPNAMKVAHPIVNVQTGGGRLRLSDGDSDRVFVFQPSGGVELNLFRWFRLGMEGGYRFVSGVGIPGVSSRDVSAPFGQINLRFGYSWGSGYICY
jgi:hypothetical protein